VINLVYLLADTHSSVVMQDVMMGKIRVMIVDDQKSIRDLLRSLVEELGAEVVSEACDGIEAVELFKKHAPDVTLMDINMPCMDGIEALQQIIALNSDALVLMLSSQNSIEVVKKCLTSGAKNFILKDNPPEVMAAEMKATWSSCLDLEEACRGEL